MKLYNKDIYDIVHRPMPHAGLIMDIVEYGDHLGLRFHADNLHGFSVGQQHDLVSWIKLTVDQISALGVPCIVEKV